jgi:hypothetical protein
MTPIHHRRVVFRPYGKMHRMIDFPTIHRAIRMLESKFDRVLAIEPETSERAAKLRDIETRRTALADAIGAC